MKRQLQNTMLSISVSYSFQDASLSYNTNLLYKKSRNIEIAVMKK